MSRGFWATETREERDVVARLLERRFGNRGAALETALEDADPLDTVYPDNPGEYRGVAWEVLVLAHELHSDIDQIEKEQLFLLMREALIRCFGSDVYVEEEGAEAATWDAARCFIEGR